MTRDDIIRMAREAGLCTWVVVPEFESEKMERFASLVAAAESEACAKLAEGYPHGHELKVHIAHAIRARGDLHKSDK